MSGALDTPATPYKKHGLISMKGFMKPLGAFRFLIAALAIFALGVHAQDYPTKPIRVIVPYAPGGTDQQIRTLAPTLQRILGQNIVVENVAGGGATIGANQVKNARPDGYTLLYTGTGALTVAPNIRKQAYTIDDFIPIGNLIGTPFIVAASKQAPFKTLAEMVAYAKANPDKVTFGSAGQSTTTHMAGEALASAAGIKLTHVPYQGIGPAVASALGGNIDMVVGLPSAIMPQVEGGKLVPLAITGPQRSDLMRGIGTLREGGVNVVDVTKFGLFAPKGTPDAIVQRLTKALAEAVTDPAFADATKKTYNSVMYMDPPQFRSTLDAENKYFQKLIRDLKLAEPG